MANTQITISKNGKTTLATAGKYCDRNIDINVEVANIDDVVPTYWQSYLESKATEINTAINAASENKSTFLWYTDAHWADNLKSSPVVLKYLSKNTGVKKTFFGGDIITHESTTDERTTLIDPWHNLIDGIPNHYNILGNHDYNMYAKGYMSTQEVVEYFLQHNRSGDMAFGGADTYCKMCYYIDNYIENTRYICLSTGRMWTGKNEVNWCIEALNGTPKDWHIVVLSHLWFNNDYNTTGSPIKSAPEAYTQPYLDMFDAYNYRRTGDFVFSDGAVNVSYDFTTAKGKVEFVVGGHVHRDYDYFTTTGIPVIMTECDANQERDDDGYSATAGSTTENCVYAFIADYDAKKIRIISIGGRGRGETASNITLPTVSTYINLLPKAEYPVGTIYNGIGYKTSTRISASSGSFEDKTETGWCTSGIIPAVAGDIVRLRNCKFAKTNTTGGSHRAGVYGVSADGTYSGQMQSMSGLSTGNENTQPVFDTDNDNIIQFKVPNNLKNIIGFRIVVQEFTENSIITVNQEID